MKRHYRIAALLALIAVFVLVVSVAPALATVQKTGSAPLPAAARAAAPAAAGEINPLALTCWPLSGPFMGTHFTCDFSLDTPGPVSEPLLFGTGPSPDGEIWGVSTIFHVTPFRGSLGAASLAPRLLPRVR